MSTVWKIHLLEVDDNRSIVIGEFFIRSDDNEEIINKLSKKRLFRSIWSVSCGLMMEIIDFKSGKCILCEKKKCIHSERRFSSHEITENEWFKLTKSLFEYPRHGKEIYKKKINIE
jgi:hypothetical protein